MRGRDRSNQARRSFLERGRRRATNATRAHIHRCSERRTMFDIRPRFVERQPPSDRRIEPTLDSLQRSPVRHRHEEGVVAGDRARHLGPASPVQGRRDGVRRARQRAQDEQEPGLVDLERQVGQELAQAVLAGRLGLDESRRQGVRGRALARHLDEAEFGDVAADGRLGRAEATVTEGGGQLLLGPQRTLVDEVADRSLPELLHDFHRSRPTPGPRGRPRRARPARSDRRRRCRAIASAGSGA